MSLRCEICFGKTPLMVATRRKNFFYAGILPVLLSLVLAIEIAAAFAPRVVSGTDGLTVQLCSESGVQTVVIDPVTGAPVSDQVIEGHCPLCVIGMATTCAQPTLEPIELCPAQVVATPEKCLLPARPLVLAGTIRAPPRTV